MKKTLLPLFLLLPAVGLAYNPIVAEPEVVYEPILVEGDLFEERNFLGDLEGNPDLYEFSSDVAFTFRAQLKQKTSDNPTPFGLLLVRKNEDDGGVTELARQNITRENWRTQRYISLGLTLDQAPVLERDLVAGSYLIEVSTPDNEGEYMLLIGEDSTFNNPLNMFAKVIATQVHFNKLPFLALLSPYVLVPILFLIIVGVWFKRRWDGVKLD